MSKGQFREPPNYFGLGLCSQGGEENEERQDIRVISKIVPQDKYKKKWENKVIPEDDEESIIDQRDHSNFPFNMVEEKKLIGTNFLRATGKIDQNQGDSISELGDCVSDSFQSYEHIETNSLQNVPLSNKTVLRPNQAMLQLMPQKTIQDTLLQKKIKKPSSSQDSYDLLMDSISISKKSIQKPLQNEKYKDFGGTALLSSNYQCIFENQIGDKSFFKQGNAELDIKTLSSPQRIKIGMQTDFPSFSKGGRDLTSSQQINSPTATFKNTSAESVKDMAYQQQKWKENRPFYHDKENFEAGYKNQSPRIVIEEGFKILHPRDNNFKIPILPILEKKLFQDNPLQISKNQNALNKYMDYNSLSNLNNMQGCKGDKEISVESITSRPSYASAYQIGRPSITNQPFQEDTAREGFSKTLQKIVNPQQRDFNKSLKIEQNELIFHDNFKQNSNTQINTYNSISEHLTERDEYKKRVFHSQNEKKKRNLAYDSQLQNSSYQTSQLQNSQTSNNQLTNTNVNLSEYSGMHEFSKLVGLPTSYIHPNQQILNRNQNNQSRDKIANQFDQQYQNNETIKKTETQHKYISQPLKYQAEDRIFNDLSQTKVNSEIIKNTNNSYQKETSISAQANSISNNKNKENNYFNSIPISSNQITSFAQFLPPPQIFQNTITSDRNGQIMDEDIYQIPVYPSTSIKEKSISQVQEPFLNAPVTQTRKEALERQFNPPSSDQIEIFQQQSKFQWSQNLQSFQEGKIENCQIQREKSLNSEAKRNYSEDSPDKNLKKTELEDSIQEIKDNIQSLEGQQGEYLQHFQSFQPQHFSSEQNADIYSSRKEENSYLPYFQENLSLNPKKDSFCQGCMLKLDHLSNQTNNHSKKNTFISSSSIEQQNENHTQDSQENLKVGVQKTHSTTQMQKFSLSYSQQYLNQIPHPISRENMKINENFISDCFYEKNKSINLEENNQETKNKDEKNFARPSYLQQLENSTSRINEEYSLPDVKSEETNYSILPYPKPEISMKQRQFSQPQGRNTNLNENILLSKQQVSYLPPENQDKLTKNKSLSPGIPSVKGTKSSELKLRIAQEKMKQIQEAEQKKREKIAQRLEEEKIRKEEKQCQIKEQNRLLRVQNQKLKEQNQHLLNQMENKQISQDIDQSLDGGTGFKRSLESSQQNKIVFLNQPSEQQSFDLINSGQLKINTPSKQRDYDQSIKKKSQTELISPSISDSTENSKIFNSGRNSKLTYLKPESCWVNESSDSQVNSSVANQSQKHHLSSASLHSITQILFNPNKECSPKENDKLNIERKKSKIQEKSHSNFIPLNESQNKMSLAPKSLSKTIQNGKKLNRVSSVSMHLPLDLCSVYAQGNIAYNNLSQKQTNKQEGQSTPIFSSLPKQNEFSKSGTQYSQNFFQQQLSLQNTSSPKSNNQLSKNIQYFAIGNNLCKESQQNQDILSNNRVNTSQQSTHQLRLQLIQPSLHFKENKSIQSESQFQKTYEQQYQEDSNSKSLNLKSNKNSKEPSNKNSINQSNAAFVSINLSVQGSERLRSKSQQQTFSIQKADNQCQDTDKMINNTINNIFQKIENCYSVISTDCNSNNKTIKNSQKDKITNF